MGRCAVFVAVGLFAAGPALACTIVNQPPPREALRIAAVVFRGTVVSSNVLPLHTEMRGRQRFAVALRVSEYWKGNARETVTVYALAPGTDCMGQTYDPAKNT